MNKQLISYHLLRILILILFLYPLTFIGVKISDLGVLHGIKIFILSSLCYILGNVIFNFKNRDISPSKCTLCYIPLLLPLAGYFYSDICSFIAYLVAVPISIFCYVIVSRLKITYSFVAKALIVICLYFVFIYSFFFPPHEKIFDIWQLYDLSLSLRENYNYYTDYIRCLQFNTGNSTSFPFLYPLLLGAIDFMTGLGLRSYLLLNAAICTAIIALIRNICLIHKQGEKWGWIAFLIFISPVTIEVRNGGTTPFSIMILIALLLLLSSKKTEQCIKDKSASLVKISLLIGALVGTACMVRFDFLPIALMIVTVWGAYFTLRERRASSLLSLATLLLFLLPWSIYSLALFDHPYIMDNSRRLIYIEDTRPSTFHPSDFSSPTLFTHSQLWFSTKMSLIASMIKELLRFLLVQPIVLIALCIFIWQKIKKKSITHSKYFNIVSLTLIAIASIYLPILFLTGYLGNTRYYTPFLALLVLLILLHIRLPNILEMKRVKVKFLIIFLVLFSFLCFTSYMTISKVNFLIDKQLNKFSILHDNRDFQSLNVEKLSQYEQEVKAYILNSEKEKQTMLCSVRIDDIFYLPRFVCNSDIMCILNQKQVDHTDDIVQTFGVTYILTDDKNYIKEIMEREDCQKLDIETTPVKYLYRITNLQKTNSD